LPVQRRIDDPLQRLKVAAPLLLGILLFAATARPCVAETGDRTRDKAGKANGAQEPLLGTLGEAGDHALYRVVVSPDGTLVATRDSQQVIRVYRLETRKRIATLAGHESRILDLAISPDGKLLASISQFEKRPLRLWRLPSGEEARIFDSDDLRKLTHLPHATGGTAVGFSADSRLLLAGNSKSLAHYSVETGSPQTLRSQPRLPKQFSPDGRLLAATRRTEDEVISVHRASDYGQVCRLSGLKTAPSAIAFSPDGRLLAAAGRRRNHAIVWRLPSADQQFHTAVHEDAVSAVVFSKDGRHLITTSWDEKVALHELLTGRRITTFDGLCGRLYDAAITPNGRALLTSGRDSRVRVWRLRSVLFSEEIVAAKIDKAVLETAWQQLADPDPGKGYPAIAAMAATPERSVAFLADKLSPTLDSSPVEKILALIEKLNDPKYTVRDRSTAELAKLRPAADALMKKALEETASPETRFRLKLVLDAPIEEVTIEPEERRRLVRLIYALELVDNPAASRLLRRISTGHPAKSIMDEAAAALGRTSSAEPPEEPDEAKPSK